MDGVSGERGSRANWDKGCIDAWAEFWSRRMHVVGMGVVSIY